MILLLLPTVATTLFRVPTGRQLSDGRPLRQLYDFESYSNEWQSGPIAIQAVHEWRRA